MEESHDDIRKILRTCARRALDRAGYVTAVQAQHSDLKIKFSNEYYDTLGLPRSDGTEAEAQLMEFAPVTFTFVKRE